MRYLTKLFGLIWPIKKPKIQMFSITRSYSFIDFIISTTTNENRISVYCSHHYMQRLRQCTLKSPVSIFPLLLLTIFQWLQGGKE